MESDIVFVETNISNFLMTYFGDETFDDAILSVVALGEDFANKTYLNPLRFIISRGLSEEQAYKIIKNADLYVENNTEAVNLLLKIYVIIVDKLSQ